MKIKKNKRRRRERKEEVANVTDSESSCRYMDNHCTSLSILL